MAAALAVRSSFLALAVTLALAGTLTGCTLGPDDCSGDNTAPLTVDELLRGMRAAGYDMYVDPGCSGDSVAWSLSNTSTDVPEIGPEDFDSALAREGVISCDLYETSEGEGPKATVTRFEGEDWIDLSLLNVTCLITPDPARAQEQIDRLELTLNEIAASNAKFN
jgi:hypothetical protein